MINEIYQDITNLDNSVDQTFEVEGDFEGDVITATGGGVAAGDDIELDAASSTPATGPCRSMAQSRVAWPPATVRSPPARTRPT